MLIKTELEQFYENHPWPDKHGIESLFRFYKFDETKIDHLTDLFVGKKIYHSLPKQLNDPFECKPHFNMPARPRDVQAIRNHLIKAAKIRGHTRKSAESLISRSMQRPNVVPNTISDSIQKAFSEFRICSFTTQKDNLLLWSHYADSHKGYCVEFDATKMPISYAYKVHYQDDYPIAQYPPPTDERGFRPALVKAKTWDYEREYRTIFAPDATSQPKNDGHSLLLSGNEIKSVYIGVNMIDDYKRRLVEIIRSGPFNPTILEVRLAKSSFNLEYCEIA